ncbi:hypothetical protein [Photobacterium sp. OFAV2-7]|uniref:hypothetical protein n=1 Tax=Photobacterium sp. OFAV2-7 TaxID=2917748 RepID=UPI001EF6A70C|nr:hypothetical protein [Photobacterium sp. OFAV2-7]MCG7586747.1 hypothetical protein [Photobacterium sp. OFAV2-7]
MSDSIEITYIGPKAVKRDTVAGTRLVFPRFKSVPTPADVAHRLLDYPTVWIETSEFKDWQVSEAEKADKLEAEATAAAEQAAKKAAEESMVVVVDGDEVDLNKLNTSAKLATFVAAQELDIAAKGSNESVEQFRTRVRDAIRQGA